MLISGTVLQLLNHSIISLTLCLFYSQLNKVFVSVQIQLFCHGIHLYFCSLKQCDIFLALIDCFLLPYW